MGLRTLQLGSTDSNNYRVFFSVKVSGTSGITPALNENGNQPQISINGSLYNSSGISVLTAVGFGSYFADLDPTYIANHTVPGDIIRCVYQGILIDLSEGDSFQVVSSNILLPIPLAPSIAQLTYVTVDNANRYFDSRVNSGLWHDTDDKNKLVSLRDSTRRIDRLNFAGEKVDDSQLLQFPRKSTPLVTQAGFGFTFALPDQDDPTDILTNVDLDEQEQSLVVDVDIPVDIQIACCEIAIALLDGRDPDLDIEQLIVDSQSYSGVRTSYTRKIALEHVRSGIPSALAWSYLKPYLRDFRNLIVSRSS